MNLRRLAAQLYQRRVYRATSMYVAAAWVLLQVADTLASDGTIPEGWVRVLIFAATLCLPFVVVGSWFLEAPWKSGGRVRLAGDLFIIAAIAAGTLLFARQQWFANVEAVDVAVGQIEATDLRPDTQQVADHLQERFAEFLDASGSSGLEVSGTLARGGDVLRLTMRLDDSTGALLWSETFEEALVDIDELQLRFLDALARKATSLRKRHAYANRALRDCPYPSGSDAILALVADDGPEALAQHIEASMEKGLLYLEQSLRWYDAVADALPRDKPVLFSMALDSLDKAAAVCPHYTKIDAIRVAYTQLQAL